LVFGEVGAVAEVGRVAADDDEVGVAGEGGGGGPNGRCW
jgi:hypothetical protein